MQDNWLKGTDPFNSLPETQFGYSEGALGNGAAHPVVRQLYDDVPPDDRSKFHGGCGEADALSQIATQHNVRCASDLRALVQGGTSTTLRNDGKPLVFCDSCVPVMRNLGVQDGALK